MDKRTSEGRKLKKEKIELQKYLQSINDKKEAIIEQLEKRKEEQKEKGETLEEKQEEKIYAEHACSYQDGIIRTDSGKEVSALFQNAFNFGENVKIYMLSINPLHFQGKHGIVRLYDSKEDDNKESLVMKIEYKGSSLRSSLILTGDATQSTINRIMDNYGNKLDFLKTDVLLASHHGASTHGSNSVEWLNLTQPKYILISNGLSYGHPSEEAYQRFHIPSLKRVGRHTVLVGKTTEKKEEGSSYKEAILHETNAAIFSTLDSGTITVNFEEGNTQLQTNKEGIIHDYEGRAPEDEKDLDVTINESDESIDVVESNNKKLEKEEASEEEGEGEIGQAVKKEKEEAKGRKRKRERKEGEAEK